MSMATLGGQALNAQLPSLTTTALQLSRLAWLQMPTALTSLSIWPQEPEDAAWLMGRRDKRTRKGKIFKGSSGNTRAKKPQQPSLEWQRQQQQTAAAQKPIPVPYPPTSKSDLGKASGQALLPDPASEQAQLPEPAAEPKLSV